MTSPPRAVPLTLGDHYVLSLARAAAADSRMHMAVAAHLPGGPPAPPDLHERIAATAGRAPVLRYRLTGAGRHAAWAPDPGFDPARHVTHHHLRPGQDVAQAALDLIADRPLPRDRPLWDLLVLHGHTPGEHVLVHRVHHAFQDALGLLSGIRALTGDERLPHPAPEPPARDAPAIRGTLADLARLAAPLPRWHPSKPPGGQGPRLLAVPLDAGALRAVVQRTGATVTQVMLALLAGALRSWRPQVWRSRPGITVNLPVSVRGPRNHAALGNHVGVFPVTLPCGEPAPYARLRAIADQTTLALISRQRRRIRALYRLPAAVSRTAFGAAMPLVARGAPCRLDVGTIRITGEFPAARELFLCPPLAPGVSAMITLLYGRGAASVCGVFDASVDGPHEVLALVAHALAELHADVGKGHR
ncbi:wax ester/triacylglycerol synthase domain-containing protein [Nonomuraea salmonea]|uniref:diacylglycerol O-acyltransferase n=1 Tax=Nonomuraea salmonea TaxID=46181 RepID=A0ABV5NJ58_9ACTN